MWFLSVPSNKTPNNIKRSQNKFKRVVQSLVKKKKKKEKSVIRHINLESIQINLGVFCQIWGEVLAVSRFSKKYIKVLRKQSKMSYFSGHTRPLMKFSVSSHSKRDILNVDCVYKKVIPNSSCQLLCHLDICVYSAIIQLPTSLFPDEPLLKSVVLHIGYYYFW